LQLNLYLSVKPTIVFFELVRIEPKTYGFRSPELEELEKISRNILQFEWINQVNIQFFPASKNKNKNQKTLLVFTFLNALLT